MTSNLIFILQKYDSILNNKSESFENKVQSLIDVWKSISELNLAQFSIRYVIQIIDWAKLHALDIVLTGEWRHITGRPLVFSYYNNSFNIMIL